MTAQLQPREDLEQFLGRADAAGQRDEGVREIGHLALARVHGIDGDEGGELAMADFHGDEVVRNDADDFAAAGERGIGQRTHQADVAAAVNEADFFRGEEGSELDGDGPIDGIEAGAGPAVDANSAHGFR